MISKPNECFMVFLFNLEVSLYSAVDSAFIAFSGKYLSPVTEDFLPDFVLHFCFIQAFKLICFFNFNNYL